jgi:hypothetical protein
MRKNILVFAIGFEAPAGGQAVMQYCASSDVPVLRRPGDRDLGRLRLDRTDINSLRLIQ